MVAAAGLSLDRVDDVEWWRVEEISEHWRRHPPMRDLVEMIAIFCGYKPPPSAAVDAADPSGIGDLIKQNPGGMIRA